MDIERQELMPDHWQKQNNMRGEEKKERHDIARALKGVHFLFAVE